MNQYFEKSIPFQASMRLWQSCLVLQSSLSDANSGHWQIPLVEKSRQFTTFITSFSRFCFSKLPFGISSAPELFQKRINTILEGLDGVICLMDDILVFGKDNKELNRVLQRLQQKSVTLNREKCEFRVYQIFGTHNRQRRLAFRSR